MERDEFYITLVSNATFSKRLYPDNKVSQFKTRLYRCIELCGGNYEMALTEIQFPIAFYNVFKDEYYMETIANEVGEYATVLTIPQGFYTDVDHILQQLNNAGGLVSEGVTFSYEANCRRVKVTFKEGKYKNIRINLSPKLREMLGFNPFGEEYISAGLAPNPVDLNVNIPTQLFVYCDVLEPQMVGDCMACVLRTVGIHDVTKFGSLFVKTYDNPEYIPIQKTHFQTIEFSIKTYEDVRVPFQSGPSLIKVHVRRARRQHC